MSQKILEIVPLGDPKWAVRYEGDETVLSRHDTLADAEVAAREHAREFGIPIVKVYELDTDVRTMILDPEHREPTPRDVKGPAAY
jgi:hypothetical protein